MAKPRSKPGEIWKTFHDYYLISNYGRVYSIRRKIILKCRQNSSGYLRARIYTGVYKHIFVHIKVVEIFGDCKGNHIPPGATTLRELGLSIDHIDRNKNHNYVSNLELVTHQENCIRRSQGGINNG